MVIVPMAVIKAIPDYLFFLAETGPLTVRMGQTSERTTLIMVFNSTDLTIKTSMSKIRAAYQKYKAMPALAKEPYKSSHLKVLDSAYDQFGQVYKNLATLYNLNDLSRDTVAKSNCVFYPSTLEDSTLQIDSNSITARAAELMPSWSAADLRGDNSISLEAFVATFKEVSASWLEKSTFQMA